MSETIPLDPDRLLEHVAWVRRLAGRLCYDNAWADDVAQETLLAALRTGPRDAVRPRPWLAAVARSVVRRMRRTTERRDARELVAARPETLPATDEIVVRASLLRAVVDAVLALPEPYRTTILLRFFEELPPRRIAERQGEPVETVRTRLKRGIAMLREKLAAELDIEADDGRRIHGLPALALLLEPVRAATTIAAGTSVGGAVMGGFLMSFAGKLTVIAVVLGAAVVSWSLLPERSKSGDPAVAASSVTTRDAGATPATEAVASAERSRDVGTPGENDKSRDAATREGEAPVATTPPNSERWADLTAGNWLELVGPDDAQELHALVDGLDSESLDLGAFLRFVSGKLADSYVVPGATESKTDSKSGTHLSWVAVYENANRQRSVWLPNWSLDSKQNETVGMVFPDMPWTTERSTRLGLPPDSNAQCAIHIRYESGKTRGFIILTLNPMSTSVAEMERRQADLKRLAQERRLPSQLSFDYDESGGRLTWVRSGASRDLSSVERERLTKLFDSLRASGRSLFEKK